jgi:hypothetical protein
MRRALPMIALGVAVTLAGGALAQAPTPSVSPTVVRTFPGPGGSARTYERRGRRDPFEPVEALDATTASPTVGSARLKGILRSTTPRALVETSDGLGYILRVGDVLGEGRLVEIGVDRVVFSVPARRGSETVRIVLRLPDD